MAKPDKPQPAININLDPKEIYKIICPDCRVKVREMTRALIKEQLLDNMVEEMTNQALSQVLPEEPTGQPPKRILKPQRVLPVKES